MSFDLHQKACDQSPDLSNPVLLGSSWSYFVPAWSHLVPSGSSWSHLVATHSSCLSRLYQSVTQLIRWADQVILQGIVQRTEEESTLSVTKVIRAVLDGVKVWLS